MVFFLESIIACAVFTLFVFLMSRDPIKTVFNYPPAIIERCDKLGLVDVSNRPGGAVFYTKKIVAMMVFGVLLGILARYVNGCTTFWNGCLTAYALWAVVNWFDALILDCLWFCHDKHSSFLAQRIWFRPTMTIGSTSRAPSSACSLEFLRHWLPV